jgi:hypothetical protein
MSSIRFKKEAKGKSRELLESRVLKATRFLNK